MAKTLVFVEVLEGQVADIGYELLDLGRTATAGSEVVALVTGPESALSELGAADRAIRMDLDGYRPDAMAEALSAAIAAESPDLVLVGSTAVGMDVATYAAAQSGYQSVAYVQEIGRGEEGLEATCLILGGKMLAKVGLNTPSVLQVLAGVGDAARGRANGPPKVVSRHADASQGRVGFGGYELPESSDVDITKAEVLISIGRGIGDRDNIELAEELAEVLGGVISSSRPIVDAGWLPKARQVGKSGNKVKPRVYLALGISGAPEHLEGMRDADCIIAVNTDPSAPIFDVAHYGIVEDVLELLPELSLQIRELKG